VIAATAVSKTFGEGALATHVLREVSLDVRAGELVLLMGPSGSGKTTLVSILAGLMRPTSGGVVLAGEPIAELGEAARAKIRRDRVGFVFQTYNLFPALSAEDNVAVAFQLRGGRSRAACREAARVALAAVGLAERAAYKPGELSSGQKQRVAIARALAGDPAVVIGDEPTAALDTESAMSVMELLRARVTPTSAMLLVTHDHRLERFADRVIAIEDGVVM
jgi:putative ABC transport system ATP-binding protein